MDRKLPYRIWIEGTGECPYFYHESELADAAPPVVEYIRADLLESDGWVSVEERLPEPRQDVLVAAYFDDGDFAIVTAYMEPDVGWISVDGGNDLDHVAHWRPLPAPPGGDHD